MCCYGFLKNLVTCSVSLLLLLHTIQFLIFFHRDLPYLKSYLKNHLSGYKTITIYKHQQQRSIFENCEYKSSIWVLFLCFPIPVSIELLSIEYWVSIDYLISRFSFDAFLKFSFVIDISHLFLHVVRFFNYNTYWSKLFHFCS